MIGSVTKEQRISHLSTQERQVLALFLAVQMQRVQHAREWQQKLVDHVREKIEEAGSDPSKVEGFNDPSEEKVRKSAILSIRESGQLARHFLDKVWTLQKAPNGHSFWISDNPLTLHNSVDRGSRGNLGLAVPGIEIHLPLASELSIWMIHPTIVQQVLNGFELARCNPEPIGKDALESLRTTAVAMKEGTPVQVGPENVTFLNSLQVINSSRFLYASSPAFGLAEEMIKTDPGIASGPRLQVI